MAKIAYILLCHKDPDAIIQQAQRLTDAGDCMAIHFDASADAGAYRAITSALGDNPNVTFAKARVKCGWGEWSLVAATLNAVRAAVEAFPRATHFYMLSGDCMPIKSGDYVHKFLDETDVDYIESFDFFTSNWIKTGMKEDRLIYRHWFNERQQKRLFYASVDIQKRFGLIRNVPADLQMMIGSQWWCLRRRTIEAVLEFCDKRRDVMRFFRTTWIPDETFFQTIVRHLVPETEIEPRTLTFLMFSDYGMPVTFYNDHYDLLLSQDFLFARKISPDADELKNRLGALYASGQTTFQTSNQGAALFRFLTGQGRVGQRFGPRIWEQNATLGQGRQLLIIACKKWHVAKRLLDQITEKTGMQGVEYLFDEEQTTLPDLGGIEGTLKKRTRHRRAFLRLVYDHYGVDRLAICLDPSNLGLMQDLLASNASARLLEVECAFDQDYLRGHAVRVGLAGETTPNEMIDQLLPTILRNFSYESEQIRGSGFANYFQISQHKDDTHNVTQLAGFLDIAADGARDILSIDYLFAD